MELKVTQFTCCHTCEYCIVCTDLWINSEACNKIVKVYAMQMVVHFVVQLLLIRYHFSVLHFSLSLSLSLTLVSLLTFLLHFLSLLSLSSALSLQFYFVFWPSVLVFVSFRLSKWVNKQKTWQKTVSLGCLWLRVKPSWNALSAWLMLFLSGQAFREFRIILGTVAFQQIK